MPTAVCSLGEVYNQIKQRQAKSPLCFCLSFYFLFLVRDFFLITNCDLHFTAQKHQILWIHIMTHTVEPIFAYEFEYWQ